MMAFTSKNSPDFSQAINQYRRSKRKSSNPSGNRNPFGDSGKQMHLFSASGKKGGNQNNDIQRFFGNAVDIKSGKKAGLTGKFINTSHMNRKELMDALSKGGYILGGPEALGGVGKNVFQNAKHHGADLRRLSGKNRARTFSKIINFLDKNGKKNYYGNTVDITKARNAGVKGNFINLDSMTPEQILAAIKHGGVVLGGPEAAVNQNLLQKAIHSGSDLMRIGGKTRQQTYDKLQNYVYRQKTSKELNKLEDMLNQPFKYNPQNDATYQAAEILAQINANKAGNQAMEQMNDRGILNSTVTSDRLGQIQQGAQNQVLSLIPELQQQAYARRSDRMSKIGNLIGTLTGQANRNEDTMIGQRQWGKQFEEGQRQFNENHDLQQQQLNEKQREFNKNLDFNKSKWQDQYGLNRDKFGFEKNKWQDQYGLSRDQFNFEKNKWNDTYNLSRDKFNWQKIQDKVSNQLKRRGLDLEEARNTISKMNARTSRDYKQYLEDKGITEQQAQRATNNLMASLFKFNSPEDAAAFIASHASEIQNSGANMSAVLDVLDRRWPGIKKEVTQKAPNFLTK